MDGQKYKLKIYIHKIYNTVDNDTTLYQIIIVSSESLIITIIIPTQAPKLLKLQKLQ